MKKLVLKDINRLIEVEDEVNGFGPSATINHWDNGPFSNGELTQIPLTKKEAIKLSTWLNKWIKSQDKVK